MKGSRSGGEVRAGLLLLAPLSPDQPAGQKPKNEGGGCSSVPVFTLESPACPAVLSDRPPESLSLSTFSSVTAGPLCQGTSQSLKTAFL